jgi:glycosyltransferase involved in cell wall biosynthesis
MGKNVDVSVVMGVYNAAAVLSATVETILSQDGGVFEFIIVNDGSKDESGRILKEYAARDNRIRIIYQENQGLTKALIKGCTEARGEYIARQDAGDVSLPGRLRRQKEVFDANTELAFISCWTEFCGPAGEFLFLAKGTGSATAPTNILDTENEKGVIDGPASHASVMFRRAAYIEAGGYRPEFYYAQDWDLWYRMAEIGKFQMLEQTLYRMMLMPGSISANNFKKQQILGQLARDALQSRVNGLSEATVLEKARLIRPGKNNDASKANDAAWFYFIGECLRRNGNTRAYSYLKEAIMKNPLSPKPWIRIIQLLFSLITRRQTSEP